MIRGLYSATSAMHAAQIQSDVISDNLANINTPGFKREDTSNREFASMLLERTAMNGGVPEKTLIGGTSSGIFIERSLRYLFPGQLKMTDLATDLALTSLEGYFVVMTPNGERYTRNGSFEVDSQGMLQTHDGYMVQGENGPIGPLTQNFEVNEVGEISDKGQVVGRLQVVNIPGGELRREGKSLYSATQPVLAFNEARILQGSLELSNVDAMDQSAKMLTVMKAYEASQRILQTQDQTLEKAVNEIGKV